MTNNSAKLTQEQKFMYGLMDDFRAFVIDSMSEGHHNDFTDHHDFIRACLETFINMQEEV